MNFKDFSVDKLYEVLQLRSEVFVVGQNCVYQDLDGTDNQSIHLCGYVSDLLVAYCRIFPPDSVIKEKCNFGRVAVAPNWQRKGIGRKLMLKTKEYLNNRWPETETLIHAQYYLKDFYSSLGFQQCGEVFDETGIPHINMVIDNN